jgi:hypothetical protein
MKKKFTLGQAILWNMWEYIPFIFLHPQYSSRNKTYEIQLYYPFSVFYLQHYFYINFDPVSNILGTLEWN